VEQLSYPVDDARVYIDYKIAEHAPEKAKFFIRVVRQVQGRKVMTAYVCTVFKFAIANMTEADIADFLIKHARRKKLFDALES
jgi:hypothetical protein